MDLGGGLEATWEPPLCRGDPKTPFLTILAPFWDPIWGPVSAHFGHHFLIRFWYSFWVASLSIWGQFCHYFGTLVWSPLGHFFAILRKTWYVRKQQYLQWFCHVGAFRKLICLATCLVIFACFLGSLFWEGFRSTFQWFVSAFGVPFGDHFGHFWGTVFALIF